jgi:hypothetical protein
MSWEVVPNSELSTPNSEAQASAGKGEKARQELTSTLSDQSSLVNPTRSKTK